MAKEIPYFEPKRLRIGDTWQWKKTLTDYPADTWTMYYVLLEESGGTNRIALTAGSDGNDHYVNIAKATTANYNAGNYSVAAYVDDGTSRETIDWLDSVRLEVLPNLETVTEQDLRSNAEKILDSLISVQVSLAAGKIVTGSENGKSYTLKNSAELRGDISYWRRVVWTEKQQKRKRQGLNDQSKHRVTFRKPQ